MHSYSRFSPAIDSRPRFADDVTHDCLQIAGLSKHRQLLIGAGPFAKDGVHVLHRVAALQFVHHIVDELQQLERQLAASGPLTACQSRSACRRCPSARRATCSLRSRLGDRDGTRGCACAACRASRQSPARARQASPPPRAVSARHRRGIPACQNSDAAGRPTRSSSHRRCSAVRRAA